MNARAASNAEKDEVKVIGAAGRAAELATRR
jgi:hypothetical protein